MLVKVSVLGVSRLGVSGNELRLQEETLAEVADRVARQANGAFPDADSLQAFVNGRPVNATWTSVQLQDGDQVMLVVPMGGG